MKSKSSHHFRGCSPGLADGDVLTMKTSLSSHIDAANPSPSATIYMTNKSSYQATHYISNTA